LKRATLKGDEDEQRAAAAARKVSLIAVCVLWQFDMEFPGRDLNNEISVFCANENIGARGRSKFRCLSLTTLCCKREFLSKAN
jgi:hypothetical protein